MNKISVLSPFVKLSESISFETLALESLTFNEAHNQIESQYLLQYSLKDLDLILIERGEICETQYWLSTDSSEKKWVFLVSKNEKVTFELATAIIDLVTKAWRNRRKHRRRFVVKEYEDEFQKPISVIGKDQLNIIKKLLDFSMCNEDFLFALKRWSSASERIDPIDSIIDTCVALETITGFESEISFKISLMAGLLMPSNKKEVFRSVRQMYNQRSGFVHGRRKNHTTFEEADNFSDIVGEILLQVASLKAIPKDKNEWLKSLVEDLLDYAEQVYSEV